MSQRTGLEGIRFIYNAEHFVHLLFVKQVVYCCVTVFSEKNAKVKVINGRQLFQVTHTAVEVPSHVYYNTSCQRKQSFSRATCQNNAV